ncbi:MAG TPA: DsbA family oxidoreductase [Gammaproteobacteria bacterium]|nr:DsbA family oxidoreductase [Gammaproteobacteria bacterium]
MRIDVFSDVVCPWCFVGKRRLDAALAAAGITDAAIHYHAFQLNPDLPPGGMDRQEYMRQKFGDSANVERTHDRVREAGRSAGIEFRFDRISRSPNTFDAHRLLALADTQGRQGTLKDALMNAYFLEGRDIGDRAVLADIASQAGMSGDIPAWLAGDTAADEVRADLTTAARLEISGVPFFIFGGRYALAGAQPPEVFAQAIEAARRLPDPGPAGPIG